MRKILIYLAVIGLAGSLWAADPTVGTWKLNIAKSKFPPTEQAPKEQTVIKRELGTDDFEVLITGVNADGTDLSIKYTHPQQGGLIEGAAPQGPMLVMTVVDPGETITTFLQDGKQVQVHHNIVSKDGKTMTQTVSYMDDQGQPAITLMVWEKQ